MDNLFKTSTSLYTYEEFLSMIENLIIENKTTGNNQSDEYLHYTKLNYQRMKRWNKTFDLEEKTKEDFKKSMSQNWFVVTEAWCGDSAQNLPLIAKLADVGSDITLRIVLRDDNPGIIDSYLTNGTRSIPILVAFDKNDNFLFRWGPRPATAQGLMEACKKEIPQRSFEEFELAMHTWYTNNKGVDTITEIKKLMNI